MIVAAADGSSLNNPGPAGWAPTAVGTWWPDDAHRHPSRGANDDRGATAGLRRRQP